MNATNERGPNPMTNRTTAERTSDRELVVMRTINGPARLVFAAWSARGCGPGTARVG